MSDGAARHAIMHLESGKRLVADVVLVSAGRIAATGPVNLVAAALKAGERGRLTVDSAYRTEVPHIFAAGDVIGYPSPGAPQVTARRQSARVWAEGHDQGAETAGRNRHATSIPTKGDHDE